MSNQAMLLDWLNGTPTGGPNNDGRYPLLGADGQIYLIPCPAAYALDPSMDPSELAIFTNAATEAAAQAGVSATDAATSASQANVSANTASTHATNAATSASQALGYRNTASTHATNASGSATAAAGSASAAATSKTGADTAKTAAETARTGAETARTKAQAWADNDEDAAVDTGKFSAKHWAAKAAAAVAGYVASARQIIAGNGLTGGGNLTADRTITLGVPSTLSGSTTNAVTATSHTHALSANLTAWDGIAPSGVALLGTDVALAAGGISRSGAFDTISVSGFYRPSGVDTPQSGADMDLLHIQASNGDASQLAFATNANVYFRVKDDGITYGAWNKLWHDGNLDPATKADSTTSITAGNGLSGGGTLAATRTVTLGTPGTITNATTNSVTATSHTHALTVTKADVGLGSVEDIALSKWDSTYVTDFRGAARAPDYYGNRTVSTSFHDVTSISGDPGGDTYTMALTVQPWSGFSTAYRTQQLAFTGSGGLKFRYATSATVWGAWQNVAMGDVDTNATANAIVQRDGSADMHARLFRSNYANQTSMAAGVALAFRVNNSTDNYIRYNSSPASVLGWLGIPTSVDTGALDAGSGTSGLWVGPYTSAGYGTLYNRNLTRSSTNYALAASSTETAINAPSTVVAIAIANVRKVTVNTAGMSVTGDFSASGYVSGSRGHFSGAVDYNLGQGGQLSWNHVSGTGKMCFFNHRGGGPGGFSFYNGTGSAYTLLVDINSSGHISAPDFLMSSDRSLKTDVKTLKFTKPLRPVTYTMIASGSEETGFIANEIQVDYPNLVSADSETGKLRLSYARLTAVLAAQNNQQELRIAALETSLATLQAQFDKLRCNHE